MSEQESQENPGWELEGDRGLKGEVNQSGSIKFAQVEKEQDEIFEVEEIPDDEEGAEQEGGSEQYYDDQFDVPSDDQYDVVEYDNQYDVQYDEQYDQQYEEEEYEDINVQAEYTGDEESDKDEVIVVEQRGKNDGPEEGGDDELGVKLGRKPLPPSKLANQKVYIQRTASDNEDDTAIKVEDRSEALFAAPNQEEDDDLALKLNQTPAPPSRNAKFKGGREMSKKSVDGVIPVEKREKKTFGASDDDEIQFQLKQTPAPSGRKARNKAPFEPDEACAAVETKPKKTFEPPSDSDLEFEQTQSSKKRTQKPRVASKQGVGRETSKKSVDEVIPVEKRGKKTFGASDDNEIQFQLKQTPAPPGRKANNKAPNEPDEASAAVETKPKKKFEPPSDSDLEFEQTQSSKKRTQKPRVASKQGGGRETSKKSVVEVIPVEKREKKTFGASDDDEIQFQLKQTPAPPGRKARNQVSVEPDEARAAVETKPKKVFEPPSDSDLEFEQTQNSKKQAQKPRNASKHKSDRSQEFGSPPKSPDQSRVNREADKSQVKLGHENGHKNGPKHHVLEPRGVGSERAWTPKDSYRHSSLHFETQLFINRHLIQLTAPATVESIEREELLYGPGIERPKLSILKDLENRPKPFLPTSKPSTRFSTHTQKTPEIAEKKSKPISPTYKRSKNSGFAPKQKFTSSVSREDLRRLTADDDEEDLTNVTSRSAWIPPPPLWYPFRHYRFNYSLENIHWELAAFETELDMMRLRSQRPYISPYRLARCFDSLTRPLPLPYTSPALASTLEGSPSFSTSRKDGIIGDVERRIDQIHERAHCLDETIRHLRSIWDL